MYHAAPFSTKVAKAKSWLGENTPDRRSLGWGVQGFIVAVG